MKKSVQKAKKTARKQPAARASATKKTAKSQPAAGTKRTAGKADAGKKTKTARKAPSAVRKKSPAPRAGQKAAAKKKPTVASGNRLQDKDLAETGTAAPTGGKTPRLNARQRENFQHLLLAMRDRLSTSISSLKNESLATKDWINVEEDGTDIFDQQFALNIVSSENEMLIQIDEALARIAMNEYGVCEECGCGIHGERLKALPFAKTCISCQSKKEGHAKFSPDSGMDGFE